MKLIQSIVWFVIVSIVILIETTIRFSLLPVVITILVLLQLLHCKRFIRSKVCKEIWDYGCPWKFNKLHFSIAVSDYLDI